MMFMPDKKKMATIILGKEKRETAENETSDHSMALEACMRRMFAAMERKDAAAMSLAFQDAFTILESEPHYENESEES